MYSNLENAYNDNSKDLDKMAKALNKKKDKLFQSQQYEFDRVEKKWKNDISSYNNYININNKDSKNIINDNNFEAYNKFEETPLSKVYDNKYNNKYTKNNNKYNNEYNDISLDSISIDSPTIDSFIDSIKSDNTIPMNKFIQKINNEECSKDSDNIYEHIKTCKECKKLLLKYIFDNHNIKKEYNIDNKINNKIDNKIDKTDYYEDIYNKRKSLFNYFGEIENKEIFIIIILGIFMIIILDFMMKGVKSKI